MCPYSQDPFHVSQDGHQHKKETQKLNQNIESGDPELQETCHCQHISCFQRSIWLQCY